MIVVCRQSLSHAALIRFRNVAIGVSAFWVPREIKYLIAIAFEGRPSCWCRQKWAAFYLNFFHGGPTKKRRWSTMKTQNMTSQQRSTMETHYGGAATEVHQTIIVEERGQQGVVKSKKKNIWQGMHASWHITEYQYKPYKSTIILQRAMKSANQVSTNMY